MTIVVASSVILHLLRFFLCSLLLLEFFFYNSSSTSVLILPLFLHYKSSAATLNSSAPLTVLHYNLLLLLFLNYNSSSGTFTPFQFFYCPSFSGTHPQLKFFISTSSTDNSFSALLGSALLQMFFCSSYSINSKYSPQSAQSTSSSLQSAQCPVYLVLSTISPVPSLPRPL